VIPDGNRRWAKTRGMPAEDGYTAGIEPGLQLLARSDTLTRGLGSHDVSNVDLVIRWGGRRRLSGFLPIQCAYADIHVIDSLWPEMTVEGFHE
jgi:undecaprenyl diphosphate synthase